MKTFNYLALILYLGLSIASYKSLNSSPLLDSITDGKMLWSTLPKIGISSEIKENSNIESSQAHLSQRLLAQQDVKSFY